MNKEIVTRVKQKHDKESLWKQIETTFIPFAGEIIVYDPDETHDYSRFKIGDGTSTLEQLDFAAINGDGVAYIDDTDNESVEIIPDNNQPVVSKHFTMLNYTGTGTYEVCPDSEDLSYSNNIRQLTFKYIPLTIDFMGDTDKQCTFKLTSTGNSTCLLPSETTAKFFTPTIDGTLEEGWGHPQVVTKMTNGVFPTVSTWVAYDEDNIYYAYRANVPYLKDLTENVKAIVYIDKAADGVVGSEHGPDSNGDKIGWWYYPNLSQNPVWQDYQASWDGKYLKKDGFVRFSTVEKLSSGEYIFEGEIKLPRTSVPYIDKTLKQGGRLPIRIGFKCDGVEYWSDTKSCARAPQQDEIRYITPAINGQLEPSWGTPHTSHRFTNGLKPLVETWGAYDDNNIYYAYRATISNITWGTNLKTIVFIDKAHDGYVSYSHGSGSDGDKIGWWEYTSFTGGAWKDCSASWDGGYLKKDGFVQRSSIQQIGSNYVLIGEIQIPRSSVPYIDAALKSEKTSNLRFRIQFNNAGVEYEHESTPVIPGGYEFIKELKYAAVVDGKQDNKRINLTNKVVYNPHHTNNGTNFACNVIWALPNDTTTKQAEWQLNGSGINYSILAEGVDFDTLYKNNGWEY